MPSRAAHLPLVQLTPLAKLCMWHLIGVQVAPLASLLCALSEHRWERSASAPPLHGVIFPQRRKHTPCAALVRLGLAGATPRSNLNAVQLATMFSLRLCLMLTERGCWNTVSSTNALSALPHLHTLPAGQ